MHTRSRFMNRSGCGCAIRSGASLAIAAGVIVAAVGPSPAAVYATSTDGCLRAGFATSKTVVAGDYEGLCRCLGGTAPDQAFLDGVWRDQVTPAALLSINAYISSVPDFDNAAHEAEGIVYALVSRDVAGDRFIDILHLGFVVGSFGEVHIPTSVETGDLNINGSGDPAGGRYHTYDGILSDERCNADMTHPYGVLDFSDVIQFITDFAGMQPTADLAEPADVYDFSDVVAYLVLFGSGCP